MIIRGLAVGPLQENCWLVVDETSRDAVLVDPGDEADRILEAVRAEGASLKAIWLTHGHFDHIGAVAAILREQPVPVYLHPADRVLYDNAALSALRFNLDVETPPPPDRELAEGDELTVGALSFKVWHAPGHSPGHVVLHGSGVLLGGDCLFAGSVGRTDLPFSDPRSFLDTLLRLASLPDSTRVLPGHGPETSIGREKASNPFLRGLARPIGA